MAGMHTCTHVLDDESCRTRIKCEVRKSETYRMQNGISEMEVRKHV